jgi:formylglycine-generating enzyme required for sulfatase activity
MPDKIFVSYRRDDDPNGAARIRDALTAKFGRSSVFMDVDDLLAGLRFDEELSKALAACDVFLAVIGPRWMDLLRTKVSSGDRDYVREEIAEAVRRKIVVIPVRVGREGQFPPLPRSDELPHEIRDLVHYQKHDITYEQFRRDAGALIDAITAVRRHVRHGPVAPRDRSKTRPAIAWLTATTALVFSTVVLMLVVPSLRPTLPPAVNDPIAGLAPGSGKSARDLLANGSPCPFCPWMVVVPAGSFTMGTPQNDLDRDNGEVQVRVSIAAPFAVGRFAVTFDEWDACMAGGGCNGYKPDSRGWGRGTQPVINVNWDDAKAYTSWLSRKTGKTYRLLSEAEREYVTRAGTTTSFWWGASITPQQANYDGRYGGASNGEYRQRTLPVDTFAPNAWGLYNVHGNVSEWTEDCWKDSNYGNPADGSARTMRDCRWAVARGGSWDNYPRNLRSASRLGFSASNRVDFVGFRVARALNP